MNLIFILFLFVIGWLTTDQRKEFEIKAKLVEVIEDLVPTGGVLTIKDSGHIIGGKRRWFIDFRKRTGKRKSALEYVLAFDFVMKCKK